MIYFIHQILGLHLLGYITVRAGFAFFLGFIFTVFAMPRFILWAKKKHAEQPIYNLAPHSHQNKCHTPTMGGLIFVAATSISTIICAKLTNGYVLFSLLCIIGFGLIGFMDDYSKIIGKKNNAGLKARNKFRLQCVLAIIIGLLLFFFTKLNTQFYLPFYKHPLFNMEIFAIFFWALVIVSSSNAVNLTDGLDGLATVPSIFSLISLGVFTYVCGNSVLSEYLLLPKIVGAGEVVVVAAALVGSLLGFLWFNCYPAEVFMGDSGSLSVGAFIGFMGIISKNEVLLIIIGFVFVLETLSVILQVGSFKIFKKRIFLMAPIHHHFEIKGWVENKIIVRFWIIALLANIIALTALKLR